MKSLMIGLLVVTMLAGCAGGAVIQETPMIAADGSKMYLLKRQTFSSDGSGADAVEYMAARANEMCRSGYTLLNQEMIQLKTGFGTNLPGGYELNWQIQCNKVPS